MDVRAPDGKENLSTETEGAMSPSTFHTGRGRRTPHLMSATAALSRRIPTTALATTHRFNACAQSQHRRRMALIQHRATTPAEARYPLPPQPSASRLPCCRGVVTGGVPLGSRRTVAYPERR